MFKFFFYLLLCNIISAHAIFAQNQKLHVNADLAFTSKHSLGLQNSLRSSNRGLTKLNSMYETNNLSSQITLSNDGYNNFTLDGSYIQYTTGIATYGVGAIDRHWSFSDKTSLILSHNARPSKSIYLKLKNNFGYDWLPSEANWSFDIFNGLTEGSINNSKSMLLGLRAILSPIKGLDFEFVQTSQWGGNNHNNGISAIGGALFFDTNINSNANINKMAGFGISYSIPSEKVSMRIYGQAIGEDEAGNLPSCYAYLAGLEWANKKIKYPTTLIIEAIDTRIDTTEAGYCGPNTMYNNHIYSYTNHGNTMGASIDSEGTSLGLFGQTHISQKIAIKYSSKLITINDTNWAGHRLSSNRQSGLINSLGMSWNRNNLNLNVNIFNQGISLDKASIKNGTGFNFSSSIIF